MGAGFDVTLKPEALLAPQIRIDKTDYHFSAPAFDYQMGAGEYYRDPQHSSQHSAIFNIKFNAPADVRSVEKQLWLGVTSANGQSEQPLQFSVTWDEKKLNAWVRSAPLQPLSVKGDMPISVAARNVPGLRVDFKRVIPSQLQHIVSFKSSEFASADFNRLIDEYFTEHFRYQTAVNNSNAGEVSYQGVALSGYLSTDAKSYRGIFLLTFSQWTASRSRCCCRVSTRHCAARWMQIKCVSSWFIPGKSPINGDTVYRPLRIDDHSGEVACARWDPQQTHVEVCEFWPSDLANVFALAGLPKRQPPAKQCQQGAVGGDAPRITSPQKNITYTLRQSQQGRDKLSFSAVTDADGSSVSGFIDDIFLGSSASKVPLDWRPIRPGKYRVRAVDDRGRADSRLINVELIR